MFAPALLLAADVFVAPGGLPPLGTAIQACTSWIAEPASWADDVEDFPEKTGLNDSGLFAVKSVPAFALPPPAARRNMHHWQVGKIEEAYFVTASDTMPICHIVGGGTTDLLPSVELVFSQDGLTRLWEEGSKQVRDDILMRSFSFKAHPNIKLHLSHSAKAGGRTDRPQVVATIVYELKD